MANRGPEPGATEVSTASHLGEHLRAAGRPSRVSDRSRTSALIASGRDDSRSSLRTRRRHRRSGPARGMSSREGVGMAFPSHRSWDDRTIRPTGRSTGDALTIRSPTTVCLRTNAHSASPRGPGRWRISSEPRSSRCRGASLPVAARRSMPRSARAPDPRRRELSHAVCVR